MSAFAIVPSVFAAEGRYSQEAIGKSEEFAKAILVDLIRFIEQFFMLEPITGAGSLVPNVYCSVAVVFLGLFLLFTCIPKKKKVFILFMTLLLTTSFFVGALNLVWHGFSVPNMIYNRFVNVYIFWLLFVAFLVIQNLKQIDMRKVVITSVLGMGICLLTFFNIEEYQEFYVYLATFLFLILYIILFILYCRRSISEKQIVKLICVFGIVELCINANMAFSCYDIEDAYENDTLPTIELTKELEMPVGERIMLLNSYPNIAMIVDRPSVGGFSSYLNGGICELYLKTGATSYGNVNLSGASPLVNTMYNIGYIVSQYKTNISDATMVGQYQDYYLFETNRTVGLGYMVDDKIAFWDTNALFTFDNQNTYINYAVGTGDVFEYVVPDIEFRTFFFLPMECDSVKKNMGIFSLDYVGDEISILGEFVVEEDMDLYMTLRDWNSPICAIRVNNVVVYRDLRGMNQQTIHIGNVKKGDEVIVEFAHSAVSNSLGKNVTLQFAKFNEENYAQAYEKLSRDVYEVQVMDGPYVSGTIDVTEDGIMATSIQAVDGFEVFVDGKQVEYERIGDALIGVPLTKGTHKVEFKYHTPYAMLGWIISGCGFVLFIILCIVGRKKDVSVLCKSE